MKEYNFNREIEIILTQVLDAIGDVVINRVDELDNVTQDRIHVNLRYSPKGRILHDIVNKNQHIQLPCMALSMASINYDQNRVFNKIAGFHRTDYDTKDVRKYYQPVPVNFSLNLFIISRFQKDMDQIVTNILAHFNPYIVISYIHPEIQEEVRCVVEWSKSLNYQYPIDINGNQPYRVTADSSFNVSGWIYRNNANPMGRIYTIDTTFQSVSAIEDYDYMRVRSTSANTDSFTISARPQPTNIFPDAASRSEWEDYKTFVLHGSMFDKATALYLSGNPSSMFEGTSTYSTFISSEKLSAAYPPIEGLAITAFDATYSQITFSALPPVSAGYFDVIVENEAGYGSLMHDAFKPYSTYQFDCVSGIFVT